MNKKNNKNNIDKNYIISAAGGNNTVIRIIDSAQSTQYYASFGQEIIKNTERFGVEQVGFLIPSEKYFTMAGGEFCGNAARAAALILFELFGGSKINFTICK